MRSRAADSSITADELPVGRRYVWLPVPVFLVAILALWRADWRASFESGSVLFLLNLVFTSIVSLFITLLAARSFLKDGQPGLLMLGCAMLLWGGSAFVATVGGPVGNYNITVHNLGVLCSALFHLAGALQTSRESPAGGSRRARLALGYSMAAAIIVLIWWATVRAWLPMFFVEGQGGTPARHIVLTISIAVFAISAAVMWSHHFASRSPFLIWYSAGLGLVATGAVGLMLQYVHGSVLGWTARAAQYLGGVFMLVGAVKARQRGVWKLSLGSTLLPEESFRQVLRRLALWPLSALLVLMLALLGFVNYLLDSARSVDQTQAVLAQISRVEKLAVDLETGIRGYRITSDPVFLEPFEQASAALPIQLQTLENLVRDNAVQLGELRSLRESLEVWNGFATNVRQRVQANLPADVPLHMKGKEFMDTVRSHIDAMQAHERDLLAASSRTLDRVRSFSVPGILLGALVFAPLLVVSLRRALITVNESHRAAIAIVEKERERVAQILKSITDGFHVIDAAGRFQQFNDAARKMFAAQGVDADSLLGKHIFAEAFPAAQNIPAGKAIQRTLTERVMTEAENVYEPWQRWYFVRNYPVAEGGVATFFQDITERKRGEEILRESEAVLRTVTSEARVGLVMVNKERRYLFANQTYAEILGLPSADIIGRRVADVLPAVYEQISPRLDRAFAGERVQYELHLPADPKTGREHFYEVVYEPRPGTEPYVVVVIVDITERKKIERALERLVAERTAKLTEMVGELEGFSYSITHDLRAPLRAVNSFAEVLFEEHVGKMDDEGKRLLQLIRQAVTRMDRLIQDVLQYSKVLRMDLKLEAVDTNRLVRGLLESYPDLQPPKATIFIEGQLPEVLANEAALTQCFSNLLNNAVKFVPAGTKPNVAVRAEAKNGRVRFWVEDNGIGIAPQYQKNIFGLFQRLTNDYEGTGVGLSIVRKALERMGGAVGVESQPGKGSRFWFEVKSANKESEKS